MTGNRRKAFLQNTALTLGSLLVTFTVLELGFRVFDPTPYFSDAEINNTEHGNLSMFDAELGWRGVPNGNESFVTRNNRVHLSHNSQGFRDIEHDPGWSDTPAVVFLGDSFTWGYEVEADEMFVNRLRAHFDNYEFFNLAHRGYGTDQSYLTFRNWQPNRPLRLVVLMFSENDNGDNNAIVNYEKQKPRFELHDGELTLTNVPVPREQSWPNAQEPADESLGESLKTFFYSSHLFNNVRIRLKLYKNSRKATEEGRAPRPAPDYTLTAAILEALQREVHNRGAELVVAFIPSVGEVGQSNGASPYQAPIAEICETLGIPHLDLADALRQSVRRSYYIQGMHWNARGHALAAAALESFLASKLAESTSSVNPQKGL